MALALKVVVAPHANCHHLKVNAPHAAQIRQKNELVPFAERMNESTKFRCFNCWQKLSDVRKSENINFMKKIKNKKYMKIHEFEEMMKISQNL